MNDYIYIGEAYFQTISLILEDILEIPINYEIANPNEQLFTTEFNIYCLPFSEKVIIDLSSLGLKPIDEAAHLTFLFCYEARTIYLASKKEKLSYYDDSDIIENGFSDPSDMYWLELRYTNREVDALTFAKKLTKYILNCIPSFEAPNEYNIRIAERECCMEPFIKERLVHSIHRITKNLCIEDERNR